MNTVDPQPSLVCCNCGKRFNGGELIQGNFYCPMCASIIHANNSKGSSDNSQQSLLDNIPDVCKRCTNHPSNGGSGICQCTLNNKTFY